MGILRPKPLSSSFESVLLNIGEAIEERNHHPAYERDYLDSLPRVDSNPQAAYIPSISGIAVKICYLADVPSLHDLLKPAPGLYDCGPGIECCGLESEVHINLKFRMDILCLAHP